MEMHYFGGGLPGGGGGSLVTAQASYRVEVATLVIDPTSDGCVLLPFISDGFCMTAVNCPQKLYFCTGQRPKSVMDIAVGLDKHCWSQRALDGCHDLLVQFGWLLVFLGALYMVPALGAGTMEIRCKTSRMILTAVPLHTKQKKKKQNAETQQAPQQDTTL